MLENADFWKRINIQRVPDVITELPSSTDAQLRECRWKRYQDSDFCVLVIRYGDSQPWKISPCYFTK